MLANSRYSELADVYSYGIVLWELLSRRCPYEGLSQVQVTDQPARQTDMTDERMNGSADGVAAVVAAVGVLLRWRWRC